MLMMKIKIEKRKWFMNNYSIMLGWEKESIRDWKFIDKYIETLDWYTCIE